MVRLQGWWYRKWQPLGNHAAEFRTVHEAAERHGCMYAIAHLATDPVKIVVAGKTAAAITGGNDAPVER
jgi:hypothetical protein